MIANSAYGHAFQVVERLNGDALTLALASLKHQEDAQRETMSGNSRRGLALATQAHDGLSRIPEARYLLGICKADIAAAHANLGQWGDAARFARESIDIVRGVDTFTFTEAAANMTLGNALSSAGDLAGGRKHYQEARRVFRKLPDGENHVRVVDHNEAQFR